MKNLIIIAIALIFFGCNPKASEPESSNRGDASATEASNFTALCIWKEVAIRETPSEKGKYRTSVYLGEKFQVLPDTSSEIVNGKLHRFQRVRLADATEGWIRTDFIAIGAVAGAIKAEAVIYKRPDAMTASGKKFFAADFVAVIQTKDGFSEVIGRRNGDTWFSSGWVESSSITFAQQDVLFSVLYSKAMSVEDESKRLKALGELASNTSIMTSVFYDIVTPMYGDDSGERYEEDSTAVGD